MILKTVIENYLLFSIIALCSYAGTYLRIMIMYYKIWKIDTNYTLMYTQILGCFLMGLFVSMKKYKNYILYTGLTSGLCGSITSFSSWSLECNKNFVLQTDFSWANIYGSYNGGRFFEWIVCLWAGVSIPLSALHFGLFIGSFYQVKKIQYFNALYIESFFAILFLVSTGVLIYSDYFLFSFLFGIIGAYMRYLLSKLNSNDYFPFGTFFVNITGTIFLSIITLLSKLYINYYDVFLQSICFSLSIGFCGCYTTVSTFVNEINTLPIKYSYLYAFTTNLIAQLSIILVYNVIIFQTIVSPNVEVINLCNASYVLCDDLLNSLQCTQKVIDFCDNYIISNYDTYQPTCTCGDFNTERITELIIDSQVKNNITNNLIPIWTLNQTESIDICLSYLNICDHYLNRIGCPYQLRKISACNNKGIEFYQNECVCGSSDTASDRIHELIIDTLLYRRQDLISYTGYVTQENLNFCIAYHQTCKQLLKHVNCPIQKQQVKSCKNMNDYSSFIGLCSCGNFDASFRVSEDIYDVIMKPNFQYTITKTNNTWDFCSSYTNICDLFLFKIGCPINKKINEACGETNMIDSIIATCECGNLTTLSERGIELIIDSLLIETVNEKYLYIPELFSEISLFLMNNPYKQLLFTEKNNPFPN